MHEQVVKDVLVNVKVVLPVQSTHCQMDEFVEFTIKAEVLLHTSQDAPFQIMGDKQKQAVPLERPVERGSLEQTKHKPLMTTVDVGSQIHCPPLIT
jgi:hypothetical protein